MPGAGGAAGQPWVFGDSVGAGLLQGRAVLGVMGPAPWGCVALCELHSWLCRHSSCWGCGEACGQGLQLYRVPVLRLQAGHPSWMEPAASRLGITAGQDSPPAPPPRPNLSSVPLLFCSLCLTNSLGFSWCFF